MKSLKNKKIALFSGAVLLVYLISLILVYTFSEAKKSLLLADPILEGLGPDYSTDGVDKVDTGPGEYGEHVEFQHHENGRDTSPGTKGEDTTGGNAGSTFNT